MTAPFQNPIVAEKFDSYPPNARRKLLALRALILETAASTAGVGEIEETLKWGEPAYVPRNKAGSTIRMDWKPKHPGQYAMYVNCQTTLVDTFRSLFPTTFTFEGDRAIIFDLAAKVPRDALSVCITEALTYHLKRKTAVAATPTHDP